MLITFLILIVGVLLVVLGGLALNLSLYKRGSLQSVQHIAKRSALRDVIFQYNY